MPDKAWKQVERRVAALFGGKRNPGSGKWGGSGSSADCLEVGDFYIEVKHSGGGQKKRAATVLTLWRDTELKALKEGLTPILVHHQHGTRLYVATVRLDYFLRLYAAYADREGKEA